MEGRTYNCGSIPQEEKARKPWKFEGYPALSKWMASSNDFFLLRRFGALNARVLLMMQDEISGKELELEALDEQARMGPDELGDSSSFRYEPRPERERLLRELKVLMKEYNEYIISYSELKSKPTAQNKQIENIKAWFHNRPLAIATEEQQFINKPSDVIAVVSYPKTPLWYFLERWQPLVTSRLFRAKHRDGSLSQTTYYHSNKGIDAFTTFIIVTTGLLLLLGPMWILQFVEDDIRRLGVITGVVLLFTALLTIATIAKPFEVLAATAAYTAVLMVFLQQSWSRNS